MLIIHDNRLPQEYVNALQRELPDADLVPFRGEGVYESILSHPDIHLFKLAEDATIHSPAVGGDFLTILRGRGIGLIKGEENPFGKYPDTAVYNAVRVGGVLLHNSEHTDEKILEECASRGVKIVDVKQGYARCSVIPVGARGLITSDGGIASAASGEGLDVLFISSGEIELPGEENGFIGGASGTLADGTVVFLGEIGCHPQGTEISDFLAKYDMASISLPGLPLYDAGTLLIYDK
ncbi:MAG: hypothetical protein P9L88_05820 [Candidatus Tantalella remota]|nr:hypothetical protein [Candidatus Tantalella remota]